MAHLITSTDKVGVGRGIGAWHDKATVHDGLLTAEEAYEYVKWTVSMQPMITATGIPVIGRDGEPSDYAVVRDDTGEVFKVVSPGYRPLQNKAAIEKFLQVVQEGIDKPIFDTVGSLEGGRKIFIAAKVSELEVVPGDVHSTYLTFLNSHDTSFQWRFQLTDIRPVCWNTVNRTLEENGKKYVGKHTSGMSNRIEEIASTLGLARKRSEELGDMYLDMVNIHPTPEQVQEVLEKLIPSNPDSDRSIDLAEQNRQKVMGSYNYGENNNLPGMEGSAYALFNSLTEWNQYTKSSNQNQESRLSSQLYGASADFAQQALQVCLTIR